MQNCIDIHVHETIRTSRYVSNVYALLLKMNRYCDINYDGRCGLHLHPPPSKYFDKEAWYTDCEIYFTGFGQE